MLLLKWDGSGANQAVFRHLEAEFGGFYGVGVGFDMSPVYCQSTSITFPTSLTSVIILYLG